mmetsp:Transcript_53566/g.130440  ORF Transcript_53566/g.130440 Transcript_53566/m.130440 type:complete len:534 (+) Transcript_53566:1232-2833(+)
MTSFKTTMIDKLLLFPTWNSIKIPSSTIFLLLHLLFLLLIVGVNVNNNNNENISNIIHVVEAFDVHMPPPSASTLGYTTASSSSRTMKTMMRPMTTTLKSLSMMTPSKSPRFSSRSFHGRLQNFQVRTFCYSTNSEQDTDGTSSSMSPSSLSATSTATTKPQTTTNRTRYTIDDSVCPPTRPHILENYVRKACQNFDTYHERKPFANHTVEAYEALIERMTSTSSSSSSNGEIRPVVLDSGCGTGRSTRHLATIFPNHWVIGVDRSFVRISRNKNKNDATTTVRNQRLRDDDVKDRFHEYNDDEKKEKKKEKRLLQDGSEDTLLNDQEEDDEDGQDDDLGSFDSFSTSSSSSEREFFSQVAPNAFLVRAELVDFWRCCYQDRIMKDDDDDDDSRRFKWNITHHYMLYPNPYPTNQRLTQRWYCHPSFPLLMTLGAQQKIVIRSNWENYLREFATAVQLANDFYDDVEIKLNTSDSILTGMTSNPMSRYVESARIGPIERIDEELALTNFEAKYDKIGEPTYELILDPHQTSGA